MDFQSWLQLREAVNKVAPNETEGMFGPVYHGTSEENREKIGQEGFKFSIRLPNKGENGYNLSNYSNGIPPPVHHLGFGVYFTTVRNIAKMFNRNTARGLKTYYIKAQRKETINWGSSNTMMKWWQKNGYDMEPIKWSMGQVGSHGTIPVMGSIHQGGEDVKQRWLQATINLTNTLKSKYDMVWYKGKGFGRLLDGDQVCVYDPNNIYELDNGTYEGEDIGNGLFLKSGDRFIIKNTKATAVVKGMRPTNPIARDELWDGIVGKSTHMLTIGPTKGKDEFDRVYRPILTQKIAESQLFKMRIQNNPSMSFEDHVQSAVNYFLNDTRNFPSALVERVLKKGERFK